MPDNGFVNGFNNPYFNPADIILPGYSALNNMFDLTGQQAAQSQFYNQLALQQQAQGFNASSAQSQRDWEERMSNTALQRWKADAEAAGFNPNILFAMNGGNGSSTPSGASASSSPGSASMANNKLAAAAGAFAVFLRMFLTKGK